MQILTFPDCLGTTTMPEYHGEGSLTGDMIPIDFIYLNSFCAFCVVAAVLFWLYEVKMVWHLLSV